MLGNKTEQGIAGWLDHEEIAEIINEECISVGIALLSHGLRIGLFSRIDK